MKKSTIVDVILVVVGIYLILQFIGGFSIIMKSLTANVGASAGGFVLLLAIPTIFGLFGAACLFFAYYRRKNRAFKSQADREIALAASNPLSLPMTEVSIQKQKSLAITIVLTILVPGLGHIYLRQIKRGVIIFSVAVAVAIMSSYLLSSYWSWIPGISYTVFQLYYIIKVYRQLYPKRR